MLWRLVDLQIEASDFVFVRLLADVFELEAVFYVHLHGRLAILRRLDIQGAGPNSLGVAGLRDLAHWVMELLDVDELRIEGATRTSGAGPGRRPAPLIFRRARHSGSAVGRPT